MLRFVLCDDNNQILNRIDKSLEVIFFKNNIDAKVVFKANTADDVLNYINNNPLDVLIIDINLKSDLSGCDIADIVRKKDKNIYIIFLTGHLEYVLLAYKYKTFDYLPKPITDERLEETILRLIDDTKNLNARFIKLNNTTFVKENDINYIKKDGMKLVFCTSERNYETYSSFSKIEHCLPENFLRCHKSYIININNVKKFNSADNLVVFESNSSCSVGAKYKNNFLEVFNNELYTNNVDSINK